MANFQKLRRVPRLAQFDRMLEAAVIIHIESSWISPVMITKMKDGSPTFCVYYRRLNAVQKRDGCPIACVDEIFDEINGSKGLTTIDLFQGYRKIKMDEEKNAHLPLLYLPV